MREKLINDIRNEIEKLEDARKFDAVFFPGGEEVEDVIAEEEISEIAASCEKILRAVDVAKKRMRKTVGECDAISGTIVQTKYGLFIRIDGRVRKRKQSSGKKNPGMEEYVTQINAFFEKNRDKFCNRINNKVLITIRQHYARKERMLDVDNMEVKPIIDALSLYLLNDDSPDQCAVLLDGVLDGDEWIEISVEEYVSHKGCLHRATTSIDGFPRTLGSGLPYCPYGRGSVLHSNETEHRTNSICAFAQMFSANRQQAAGALPPRTGTFAFSGTPVSYCVPCLTADVAIHGTFIQTGFYSCYIRQPSGCLFLMTNIPKEAYCTFFAV